MTISYIVDEFKRPAARHLGLTLRASYLLLSRQWSRATRARSIFSPTPIMAIGAPRCPAAATGRRRTPAAGSNSPVHALRQTAEPGQRVDRTPRRARSGTSTHDSGSPWVGSVSGMSYGFSGNMGFALPENWSYNQVQTLDVGSGAGYIDIDKDVHCSGTDAGVSSVNDPEFSHRHVRRLHPSAA